jgi:hypothetical protein
MPIHVDAYDLPIVKAMLNEDEARFPVTEQRWLAIVDLIPVQVGEFQANVKHALIRCLRSTSRHWRWDADENPDFAPDLAILEKPSSLFTCTNYGCQELIGYPAIFTHIHMRNLMWSQVAGRLYHETEVKHTVNMVLEILRLPGDTSLTAMEELDGRLVCLCGHPNFRKSMTFKSLVRS